MSQHEKMFDAQKKLDKGSVAPQSKPKRFKYTPAWDFLLLKAISSSRANLIEHGKAIKLYGDASKLMMETVSRLSFEVFNKPKWKSVRDRFKKIVDTHSEMTKKNESASGIVEV